MVILTNELKMFFFTFDTTKRQSRSFCIMKNSIIAVFDLNTACANKLV